MNQIAEKQNQPDNLRRLAAQRQLYRESKRWTGVLLVSPIVLALAGNLAYLFPAGSAFAAFYALIGVVFTVVEYVVFNNLTSKGREEAARIQELFDCDVLELPWNEMVGEKPEPSDVERAAQRFVQKTPGDAYQTLRTWYDRPTPDPSMALPLARVVCQKQNIKWDTHQRRSYARRLFFAMGAYAVILFVIGMAVNSSYRQPFEGPAIFAITVLVIGGKHAMDHHRAADQLDELKVQVTALLQEAKDLPESASLTAKARDLQTEIFHHRKEHPPIFDWYYELEKTGLK